MVMLIKKPQILLVDDDPLFLKILFHVLKHDFAITEAKDGAEALQKFKDNQCDLVISDLIMPILDGFVLISEISKISDVPIISMSRSYNQESVDLAASVGAKEFMLKTKIPLDFLHISQKHTSKAS